MSLLMSGSPSWMLERIRFGALLPVSGLCVYSSANNTSTSASGLTILSHPAVGHRPAAVVGFLTVRVCLPIEEMLRILWP